MKKYFDLSVHQLVDFLLRSGDIDSRVFNTKTMNEGVAIHQYYQKMQNDNYTAEVPLQGTIHIGDYTFFLHGRADGIIKNGGNVTIDEIKSTNIDLEEFYIVNKDWHLGQAECYAYLYAKENKLNFIDVTLTYISQKTKRTMTKSFSYSFGELENKLTNYLSDYIAFLAIFEDIRNERDKSIENLEFPFPYLRKGQKEMMDLVSKSIDNKEISFVEAATGIGKTIATIYPSLSKLKEGKIDKFFYLTAKNSGFDAPMNLFRFMHDKGLKTKTVVITAKEKMCMNTGKQCNPQSCIFARGYFTKIKSVIKSSLLKYDIFDEQTIKDIAFEKKVCPFELSLDLSLYCDYIICDYNYAFHPTARLKRFFENPDDTFKIYFFIDEAHNMISRSRDMYSAELFHKSFLEAKKILKEEPDSGISKSLKELTTAYNKFNKFILYDPDDETKIIKDINLEQVDGLFIKDLNNFSTAYMEFCAMHPKFYSKECETYAMEVFKFLKILEKLDNNYQIYLHRDSAESKEYYIKIFCLDASNFIKEDLYQIDGATMFSATFTPFDYYQKLIMNREPDNTLILDTPFNPAKFNLMVNTTYSLFYKDRLKTLFGVMDMINAFCSKTVGNYLIFLPSYEYLRTVKENIEKIPNAKYLFQSPNMTNKDKRSFTAEFKKNPTKTLIAFTVLGGNFNEGIDLVEDRLIGVCVVGVGLPSFDYENKLLKTYYDTCGYNGYDFAFVNPGINHVMQAVGRLIRTDNDIGSALLIDLRYNYANYRTLFNKEWKNAKSVKNSLELEKLLEEFNKNWYNH